jgi:hypothetical protein
MAARFLTATVVMLLAATCLWAQGKSAAAPKAADILAGLRQGHPRLVLTDQRLAELKQLAPTDKLLAKAVKDVIAQADALAEKPELVYKKIGPRLLNVSRDCVNRMYCYGLAWRWTGDEKYIAKARATMLAVCAFKDWNPSHFLDTAEMSHGVGIGYDWFYDKLDEPTRSTIRKGLISLGMEPGRKGYRGKGAWWASSEHNWNQVCNMGLSIGALAIADTDGQCAGEILSSAVASLPKALKSYAPDGAWGEGPGYWSYATRYTAYGLAAMDTALGTDFGLSEIPGLDKAGYFPIYTTGPTGLMFGFADAHTPLKRGNLPELFWLARRYNNQFFAEAEREMIARRKAAPNDVIWYVPPVAAPQKADLARLFRGPVPVAVLRTSWLNPDAVFLAFKAGYNMVNHAHLDLGQFELDALGVRWVRDIGSDDYNLPSYFHSSAQDAQRWKYYRLGSASHSVVTLDGDNQNVQAVAKLTDFLADGVNGFAVADLTSAYTPKAKSALRGVRLVAGRAVLVQDELDIAKACQAAWGITTDAKVSAAGAAATLTLDGRTLTARILQPQGATFAVESAEQNPPQAANTGVSRLVIRTAAQPGLLRFAVLLSPQAPGAPAAADPKITPLADWKSPVPAEQPAEKRR